MDDIFQQIKWLQQEIEQRKKVVAELETDVRDLNLELEDFSTRYEKVLHALNRVDAVKQAIAELERQRRVKNMGEASPLRQRPWQAPSGYVPVEEQVKRRRPTSSFYTPPSAAADDAPVEDMPRAKAGSGSIETQLKRLYRKLALRFHPDRATDADDAQRLNERMALINEAYANKDLDTLLLLDDDPDSSQDDLPLAKLRLRHLQQTHRDLARRIEALKQEQFDLMHNSLMDLKIEEKLAASQGRDLLGEIVTRAEADYWEAMSRLDALQKEL